MSITARLLFLCLLNNLFITANAQVNLPDSIKATFTNTAISLDGKLSEKIWTSAFPISNFNQRELDFGKPVTEPTRVAIVYDKLALYIGVWCFQKSPIRAKFMQRDFNYEEDDNFQVA